MHFEAKKQYMHTGMNVLEAVLWPVVILQGSFMRLVVKALQLLYKRKWYKCFIHIALYRTSTKAQVLIAVIHK